MTARAPIRRVGGALLVVLVLLTALGAPWTERLQSDWFDLHQVLWPRPVTTLPVTVVEIDAKSIQSLGQWPWPRSTLARLVDTIATAQPAAIGLDILMPEADALSPERLLARNAVFDEPLIAALKALPSNDADLGDALRRSRTVLAVAGLPDANQAPLRSAPVLVQQLRPAADATPELVRHAGALTSIDVLDSQAQGWGLISVDTTRGVVRRMPLAASVRETIVPALSIELLRVAMGETALRIAADGSAMRSLQVGSLVVPTESNGLVRPWFSPRRDDRFLSAVDVLRGTPDPAMLKGQIVIVAPTALGLIDYHDTPIGERMPGSEIHAQLIENLVAGSLLQRPPWAARAEAAWLLVLGGLLVGFAPRAKPFVAAAGVLALVLVTAALGAWLFHNQRLLLDAATPGLALLVLFMVLLLLTLAEAAIERKALEARLQLEREKRARLAGELDAARRIQTGSLPRLDLLRDDRRIELHATLTPAREVGGDLYDFFRLDDRRLFFLIGDVAGKGLSASIFMAVSKALYKGSMLRAPHADIGDVMTDANLEVSRDNAEMLFVTAFAAILDLDSGELHYCNAGHDNPWRASADGTALARITDGDGPPLCALPDFQYGSASCRLNPGDTLWLMTDGVTEATDASSALYGSLRVEHLLADPATRRAPVRTLVEALQADVERYAAGTEPADDLTILALRWHGPAYAGTTSAS